MTPKEVADIIFAALNRPGVRKPRRFQLHDGSVIQGKPLGVGGWETGMFVLLSNSITNQPVKILLTDVKDIGEIDAPMSDVSDPQPRDAE